MFKGFQKPKRLVANTETLTERYGQFTAQPFERGFGTTIGNGLRRVLLSSIEGAAITAVRIEGVAHEFMPIPGVVEDATDIILNLKQIPFKMSGEGTRTARLRIEQAGEVLSGQIETDSDVEVLDRNMHIATVGEGGRLNVEMRLKSGRGYVSRRPQFRRGSAARLYPDRLGSFAGSQGQLHRRGGTPRPDDRLRQADHRSLVERRHFAAGCHRSGRQAPQRSHDDLHQLRRSLPKSPKSRPSARPVR